MIRVREADVILAVTKYLTDGGFVLIQEFPILGKVVDIFGLRIHDEATIAVECKEKDWRRAGAQARVSRVISHSAYVAMPAAHVSESASTYFKVIGLGLLVVTHDGHVEKRLEPEASKSPTVLHQRARQRFFDLAILGSHGD